MSANFNTSESGSTSFIYDDDEQVDGKQVRAAYLKRQLERPNKIYEALKYLVEPGTVTELRAFEVQLSETYKVKTVSGYYDYEHLYDMAVRADELTDSAPGVYYVLNPIDPEMLSHRCNRTANNPRSATKDADILRLTRLLIDVDSRRRSKSDGREIEGVSATNAEKARAHDTTTRVLEDLSGLGWPRPVFIDSGNGYYLVYRINLTTNQKDLVVRCLKALEARYSDPGAKIDPQVFNPSRCAKIPYTMARKGDPTPERPHRQSSIISVPEVWTCVPTGLLEALAATAPAPPQPRREKGPGAKTTISCSTADAPEGRAG